MFPRFGGRRRALAGCLALFCAVLSACAPAARASLAGAGGQTSGGGWGGSFAPAVPAASVSLSAAQPAAPTASAAPSAQPAAPACASPAPTFSPACAAPPDALAPTASPAPAASPSPSAALACRAVWFSYLDWRPGDFASAAAFSARAAAVCGAAAGLGANTLLLQVRPFCDALYPSRLFPFSHLCTGAQGVDPGFDPLGLFVAAAHAAGLRLVAWVNPYRVSSGQTPAALAGSSPAVQHPDWVKTTSEGRYLDPASPAVRAYIAQGLDELCGAYAVDGVQFDDYFYPDPSPGFDAAQYAAYAAAAAAPLSLAGWRRQNVSALVSLCWQTVHRHPGVSFTVSPQGDPDAGLATQYADAAGWLAAPGYVDGLVPQLYWGLGWRQKGSDRLAAGTLARRWLALPRAAGVTLCFGLAASRIGGADGRDATSPAPAEWRSGRALADAAALLAGLGADGVAIYRYGSLFENPDFPALAGQEENNLAQKWSAAQF